MPCPRRFLFLCLAAVALELAVGVWALWPRTAITLENAAKIRPGMTLGEAVSILGGPARNDAWTADWNSYARKKQERFCRECDETGKRTTPPLPARLP